MKKLFYKFWKWAWICLGVCLIIAFAFFIFREIDRQKKWRRWKKEKEELEKGESKNTKRSCPHHFSDPEKDRLVEKLRLITGWNCDYCGKRVIEKGNDYLTDYFSKKEEHFSLVEKHLAGCQEAQKVIGEIDVKKGSKCDDENSLKDKGYSEGSINKIKSWGLLGRISLPDLKDESRIGVVKELSVVMALEKNSSHLKIKSGKSVDGLVFLVPRVLSATHQDFPNFLAKSNFFFSVCGSKEAKKYEEIITAFFIWRVLKKQRNWDYNVYFLESDEECIFSEFTFHEGNSASAMLYLSLLSAYYQKPISKGVAAAATIDFGKISKFSCIQCFWENELTKSVERNFSQNKTMPIGCLSLKVEAAVKAGVKKLILSIQQKEDYEKNMPQELKQKLQVYYVKNVEELEELFWKGEFS